MVEPWEERVPPGGPWFGGTSGGGGGAVDSVNGKTGAVTLTAADVNAKPASYVPDWDDITGKPETFGSVDSVNGKTGEVEITSEDISIAVDGVVAGTLNDSLQSLSNTLVELVPTVEGKADASHTHEQSEITGLSTALSGKANTSHTHEQSDITGLSTALSGKANTSHTHTASNITDFNSAADGRIAASTTVVKTTGNQTVAGVKTFSSAPVVPDGSFSIAKTSGLQAALDGKVGSGNASVTGIELYDSVEDLPATGTSGVIYVVPAGE